MSTRSARDSVGPYVVPNYDIYGHHHCQKPYKDKSHLLQKEIRHPKWLEPAPEIKSRSELMQARKIGRTPDPRSYDFDGDGVVGSLDYFIGKCFDGDSDGRLTTGERRRADKALQNGFIDKYVTGLDSTGQVHRGCFVKQKRGVICAADNPAEASVSTYPPHHNAHKIPEHYTRTSLDLHRKAEAKGNAIVHAEKWAARCEAVAERQPPNHETAPRQCAFEHIRERAEADHQLARVRGGLLPMNAPVNPEREHKMPSLDRVHDPIFKTRSQLLETRREAMKRECEDLRAKGDEVCVPLSVRNAEKEAHEFEFRRPREEPMTLTKMKDNRRRDKIEYDMNNFGFRRVAPREYPKFSDHPDIPFWVSDQQDARVGASPPPAISRTVSEPVFKVNEVAWGDQARHSHEALPDSAHDLAAGKNSGAKPSQYGSKTVKRWSADMLERGQGRNQPRLFDSIKPVRIGPKDLESLDLTSSMEPVRTNALRRQAEERKANSMIPKKSQLYSDPNETQPLLRDMQSMATAPKESADAVAMGAMQRAAEPSPTEAMEPPQGGTTRPGVRRPLVTAVMSTDLRAPPPVMENMTKPKEPRFFGGSGSNLQRDTSKVTMHGQTGGVRSGGFQRLDASMNTMTKPALAKSRSKDRPKSVPKDEAMPG